MSRLTYRPEIDGLRALAVMAVVLFHSHLRVPGGYVGVDIFFVISGYLITGLIAADLAAGTFSLRDFWERRVRRIVPAASVTVIVCLVLGFALMLPPDFEALGRSAVAQALLVANHFFLGETGYFAAPAENQPLLHFWSLAVEEQFYLFFPCFLLALHRRGERAMFRGVAVLAAGSFGLSIVGVRWFPEATFFLLPTRAWELALGALLALRGGELPLASRLRAPLGWAGVGLMVAPMALYDADTPFPGLAAVPPCAGAALVIWATGGETGLLKRMLALRPVVGVGLMSYSLYLWHWPVKVFSHYWFTGLHSPAAMRVAVVVASFGLAWLSWRFVEKPFRSRRGGVSVRWAFAGAAAAVALTLTGGGAVAWRNGVPERFSQEVVRFAAAYEDRPTQEEADLTLEDAAEGDLTELTDLPAAGDGRETGSVLLWGDSHARVVSPALEILCVRLGVKGYRASRSATAPLLAYGDEEFRRYNEAVFHWVEAHRPTLVVLVSRWERVLRAPEDQASLRATIDALRAVGVKVAVMRQVAAQQRDIPKTLALASLLGDDVEEVGVAVEDHEKFTHRSNDYIDEIAAATPGLLVLDPIPYLSENGRCLAEWHGRPLYYDYQHLTRFGAGFLTPMFEPLLRSVMPRSGQSSRRRAEAGTRADAALALPSRAASAGRLDETHGLEPPGRYRS